MLRKRMKVDVIDGLAYGIQQYLASYKHRPTNETERIRTQLKTIFVLLGTPKETLVMLL